MFSNIKVGDRVLEIKTSVYDDIKTPRVVTKVTPKYFFIGYIRYRKSDGVGTGFNYDYKVVFDTPKQTNDKSDDFDVMDDIYWDDEFARMEAEQERQAFEAKEAWRESVEY